MRLTNKIQLGIFSMWVLLSLAFSGCGISAANEQDYSYGKTKLALGEVVKFTNELTFKAQYTPIHWQAKQAGEVSLDNFLGHLYIQLKIKPRDSKNSLQNLLKASIEKAEASTWNDFLFNQKGQFSLQVGNNDLPCVLYHVTPSGLSGQGAFLTLVFKDIELDRTGQFISPVRLKYQDDLWTNSLLIFEFSAEELNHMPLSQLVNLYPYESEIS